MTAPGSSAQDKLVLASEDEARELRRKMADWGFIESQPPKIREAAEEFHGRRGSAPKELLDEFMLEAEAQ